LVPLRLTHYFLLALLAALVASVWSRTGSAEQFLRCGRFSGEEIPAATPRADRQALGRLEQINEQVKSVPHSVIFFGDSLTEGWDPGIWQQQLAPRSVLNAGISGDRTDHLLWRLEHGNLGGPPPKAVILLIGTNDLSSGRSPEASADGISANLALLRRRLPDARILLLGLLPREEDPNSALRRAVERVNALTRGCADAEHIFYADIGNVLLDGRGRLDATISPDHLHFSGLGYALLAAQLGPELDRLAAPSP
jgi:lysophospholipase L1-like esterase